jgi:hypothetical protein
VKAVDILLYVFSFTCIIPAFIGLRNYGRLSPDFKALTLYMLASVLFEIPSNYYFYHKMNNLFIIHYYTVVEFVFLTYIYSIHIHKVISKKILLVMASVFVLGSVLNSVFVQSFNEFNSYARCIEIILVLIFSFAYVYELIRTDRAAITNIPMFWVNAAVFVNFIAGLFLYLVSNNLISFPRHVVKNMWTAHGMLLAAYYLTIAKAIWNQSRHQ